MYLCVSYIQKLVQTLVNSVVLREATILHSCFHDTNASRTSVNSYVWFGEKSKKPLPAHSFSLIFKEYQNYF